MSKHVSPCSVFLLLTISLLEVLLSSSSPVQAFKTYGLLRHSTSCSSSEGSHCRTKRSLLHPKLRDAHLDLELLTEHPLHHIKGPNSEPGRLQLRLKRSPQLLAPNFKFVVNEGNRGGGNQIVNDTIAFPKCLYTGDVNQKEEVVGSVALSNCVNNRMKGLIQSGNSNLVIEELDPSEHPEHLQRVKRSISSSSDEDEDDEGSLIVVYENSQTGGECGINKWNKAKMTAPLQEAILLSKEEKEQAEKFAFEQRNGPQKKQSASEDEKRSTDKAIELAIFVDDEIYQTERKTAEYDEELTLENIRKLVFTYLNSVQLLYNSARLSTQIRIVLVRLEVFKDKINHVNKTIDVDAYLDTFCVWQNINNLGDYYMDPSIDTENSDHWDHGLVLTGLNLRDAASGSDKVIGLAWVKGMCYPDYTCSISEGLNFESVFVIAHEIGHNLGMQHDGDIEDDANNTCDPTKFLMSPNLGPGKIHFSECSNQELKEFLTGRTEDQSKCLDDLPSVMAYYDYIKDTVPPGRRFNADTQCKKAFGEEFTPHKTCKSPYDDFCRELWCVNGTHTARAHPALEGTECDSKPSPYGSICISGECLPYDPDNPTVITYGTLNKTELPVGNDTVNSTCTLDNEEKEAFVANRPSWYDPIYTKIFEQLKNKISKKYLIPTVEQSQVSSEEMSQSFQEKQQSELSDEIEQMEYEEEENFMMTARLRKESSPNWVMVDGTCTKECGAGWAQLSYSCVKEGSIVNDEHCSEIEMPKQTSRPCNVDPCK